VAQSGARAPFINLVVAWNTHEMKRVAFAQPTPNRVAWQWPRIWGNCRISLATYFSVGGGVSWVDGRRQADPVGR
jgi:hypothetical protein